MHDPICTESGNLEAALYGSFLPIPSDNAFPILDEAEYAAEKAPGAIIPRKERIIINKGRERIKLRVTNNGDRPVQVRALSVLSHAVTDLSSFRLGLIITLSKPTLYFPLIAPKHMENDWIFPPELLSVSNLAM